MSIKIKRSNCSCSSVFAKDSPRARRLVGTVLACSKPLPNKLQDTSPPPPPPIDDWTPLDGWFNWCCSGKLVRHFCAIIVAMVAELSALDELSLELEANDLRRAEAAEATAAWEIFVEEICCPAGGALLDREAELAAA